MTNAARNAVPKLTKYQRAWLTIPAGRQTPAIKALADYERGEKPAGSYDNASRWWPDQEFECCALIRSPSRAWPFSKLKHCLSQAHKEALHGAEHRDVLALRRVLDEHAQAINASLRLVTDESLEWLGTLEAQALYEVAANSADAPLLSRQHTRL